MESLCNAPPQRGLSYRMLREDSLRRILHHPMYHVLRDYFPEMLLWASLMDLITTDELSSY